MKNKFTALISGVCALGVGVSAFTACAPENKPVHEHTLFDVAAVEATCISEGSIEYKECLYCRKKYVGNKEISEEEVKLSVNANNHKALQEFELSPAKCFENGKKAHSECGDCGALLVNGETVSEDDIVLTALGDHNWKENGLECEHGDGYKIFADGNAYVVDARNSHAIAKPAELAPSYLGTVATKKPYIEEGYHLTHRMEFATQVANITNNVIDNSDGNWAITNKNTTNNACFTRFAYGTGETGYVGKFIMTYDFTVSAEATIQRIGVKVVDSTANANDTTAAVRADTQSKLLGNNATEENNAERTLTPNVVYTFSYLIELTAEDQLIQIWNDIKGEQTATISNLHFVNIEGEGYGIPCARLIYFGESGNKVAAKEDCTHQYAYAIGARAATCEQKGVIAHTHCPVCGLNTVDGNPYDGEVILDIVPHTAEQVAAKAATCTEEGWNEHYKCSTCEKRFSDVDCKNDVTDSYLLPVAPHTLQHRNAEEPTCFKDGVKEHYECSVCKKLFADAQGQTEQTAAQLAVTASHEFKNGVCTKGCGVSEIVSIGTGAFATTGDGMYPYLIANPGKWGCQTQASGVTAKIENSVLYATVSAHNTAKTNKAFIRVIPAKDGQAFVGTYELTFDFTVTKALGDAAQTKLQVGYFIKAYDAETTKDVNKATIADVDTVFEVGKTYRFTVLVETLDAGECIQLNVRNTAKSGAEFEIKNAKFVYKDASENTGDYRLQNVAFAEIVA